MQSPTSQGGGIARPALVLFALLAALTGLAYPLAVTGAAQALFPAQAAGSLVVRDGRTVGSRLIGQNFSDPKHFWGRPSATAPQPYDANASGGSNLGPLNPAAPVPVDLVTASGSGLDPHISPAAARYQAARVARTRGLPPEQVEALIARHTEEPLWGVLGEPRVNVLALNLALDAR